MTKNVSTTISHHFEANTVCDRENAWFILFYVDLHALTNIVLYVSGKITCECTTLDCEAEGKHTCDADYFCYVETMGPDVTRGCINHKSPLLCENRKPAKLSSHADENWPLLFCCKDEDFCNRDILPVKPTEEGKRKFYITTSYRPLILYTDILQETQHT